MPLTKTLDGATFWRYELASLPFWRCGAHLCFKLYGYTDAASFANGDAPLTHKTVEPALDLDAFIADEDNIYRAIMALPAWADAILV